MFYYTNPREFINKNPLGFLVLGSEGGDRTHDTAGMNRML